MSTKIENCVLGDEKSCVTLVLFIKIYTKFYFILSIKFGNGKSWIFNATYSAQLIYGISLSFWA